MAARSEEADRSNRAKILRAAISAFAQVGFEGASLRGIAENADVPFQSIAYYFGSKADLWKAALDQQYERYLEMGKGLGFTLSGNIFEQFRNHLFVLLTNLLQRPQLRSIWVQEFLAKSDRYEEIIKPQIKDLHDNLARPYYEEVVRLGIVKKYSAGEITLIVGGFAQLVLTYSYYLDLSRGDSPNSSSSLESYVDLLFRILTDGAIDEATEIDAAARAHITTPVQDRLSRMEEEIAELRRMVSTLRK